MVCGAMRQMAVLLAMLHGGLHGLLDRRVQQIGRQIAGRIQKALGHRAADGLPHVLREQHQVAGR